MKISSIKFLTFSIVVLTLLIGISITAFHYTSSRENIRREALKNTGLLMTELQIVIEEGFRNDDLIRIKNTLKRQLVDPEVVQIVLLDADGAAIFGFSNEHFPYKSGLLDQYEQSARFDSKNTVSISDDGNRMIAYYPVFIGNNKSNKFISPKGILFYEKNLDLEYEKLSLNIVNEIIFILSVLFVFSLIFWLISYLIITKNLSHLINNVKRIENGQNPFEISGTVLSEFKLLDTALNSMNLSIKAKEYQISRNEERLLESQDAGKIGTWEWTSQSGNIFFSKMFSTIHQMENFQGSCSLDDFLSLLTESDRERLLPLFYDNSLSDDKFEIEYTLKIPNQDSKRIRFTGRQFRDSSGKIQRLAGIVRDRTVQYEMTKTINDTLSELKKYQDALDQYAIVAVTDRKGMIIYVNDNFCKVSGYSRDQIIGNSHKLINSNYHPASFFTDMWIHILQGKIWRGDIRNINKNGEIFWLDTVIVPSMDDAGRLDQYFSISTEITELKSKNQETENLYKQLHHSQKMETVGLLVGGISHDFNNILSTVIGYSQLGLVYIQDENTEKISNLKECFEEVEKAGKRARDLIRQLLAFSRGDITEPVAVDPAEALREMRKMIRPAIPSSIEIELKIPKEVYKIKTDPVQINQVLLNLVINAKDSITDEKGKIEAGIILFNFPHQYCTSCKKEISGEFIDIYVKDSGTGIQEKHLNRIFDPFFTTKEIGKGTGMGLSVVHGIIHGGEGHLIVESMPGYGTTIHLLFKKAIEENAANPKEEIKDLKHTALQGKNVLLVDDEVSITGYLKALLENSGMKVAAFNDPLKALRYFEENENLIDVVLTDQTMPVLKGTELAEKVLSKKPGLPVILCSGYSSNNSEAALLNTGIRKFMNKPIDQVNLFTAILEVLS